MLSKLENDIIKDLVNRTLKKPAFDKSKRTKAYGCYTGCPCSITLAAKLSTTDFAPTGTNVVDLIAQ